MERIIGVYLSAGMQFDEDVTVSFRCRKCKRPMEAEVERLLLEHLHRIIGYAAGEEGKA